MDKRTDTLHHGQAIARRVRLAVMHRRRVSHPPPVGRFSDMTDDILPPGTVRKLGKWTVGNSNGTDFAVSSRCRHQFADLSKGSIDADGCLVCPWHGSRYDVGTGEMVSGPKGFLAYRGPTPGYTQFIRSYGKRWKLQVKRLLRADGELRVE